MKKLIFVFLLLSGNAWADICQAIEAPLSTKTEKPMVYGYVKCSLAEGQTCIFFHGSVSCFITKI